MTDVNMSEVSAPLPTSTPVPVTASASAPVPATPPVAASAPVPTSYPGGEIKKMDPPPEVGAPQSTAMGGINDEPNPDLARGFWPEQEPRGARVQKNYWHRPSTRPPGPLSSTPTGRLVEYHTLDELKARGQEMKRQLNEIKKEIEDIAAVKSWLGAR